MDIRTVASVVAIGLVGAGIYRVSKASNELRSSAKAIDVIQDRIEGKKRIVEALAKAKK